MHDFGRKLAEKIGIVAQEGSNVTVGEIRIGRDLSRQEYRNRQALLTKVKNFWVKGVLEKSLHEQVLITLGLQNRPDAVESPWNLMLGTEDQSPQDLPPDTSVISIFDDIGEGRTLLILGEPGSGKTITLLQLARDLINRAEQDTEQRIPVVFNLSSWKSVIPAKKGRKTISQTIAAWLVEELSSKYQVPRKMGEAWVKRQQLLLLLDGLDEVRMEDRDTCIAAINDFQQEFGTEIVVCCRVKDYEALQNHLNFQSALYLRSLSAEQIQDYLNHLTADVTGLKTLLAEDFALQELAQSPLLLNIMVLAYEGISVSDLPQTNALAERRKQLFDTYIQRMLSRRGIVLLYPEEKIVQWLACLAQRMMQESQTVFLIENMQPTWLETFKERRAYRISSLLLGGLGYGILPIIISSLLGFTAGVTFGLKEGLLKALLNGLLFGLLFGLFFGLLATLQGMAILGFKAAWKGGLANGLVWGIPFVAGGLLIRQPLVIVAGLLIGASVGLFTWLQGLLVGNLAGQVELAEKLQWSWQKTKRGAWIGLLLGFLSGLISGLTQGLAGAIAAGLFYGTFYAMAGGLLSGVSAGELESKHTPNQGIWRSVKSCITVGLTTWLGIGLSIGMLFGLAATPKNGLVIGLLYGQLVSAPLVMLAALKCGGKACIQHFTLRTILYRKGRIPWNYAKFLDYATERLFLQKVGGGYIFVHRLLMEHFAELESNN